MRQKYLNRDSYNYIIAKITLGIFLHHLVSE